MQLNLCLSKKYRARNFALIRKVTKLLTATELKTTRKIRDNGQTTMNQNQALSNQLETITYKEKACRHIDIDQTYRVAFMKS